MKFPDDFLQRLAVACVKSSAVRTFRHVLLLLCLAVWPFALQAHETRPAIADIQVGTDAVALELTLSLEAPLAGIDLDGLADTDDAPQATDYDLLRGLPAAELENRLREAWPELSRKLHITTQDGDLAINLDEITVPDIGDTALPRDTLLVLSAKLPPGTDPVTFAWDRSLGPIILRQVSEDPDAYAAFLQGGEVSAPFPRDGASAQESHLTTFVRYIGIGFDHIIPKGLDHILFVLGLYFFSTRLGPLLWQVTAFTVAHTVTLALATYGVVNLPPDIVEPLIALSIAYVGLENVIAKKMTPWRPALVFAFGLLHGLGFASVLGDVGLSPGLAALSLIGFNIGVEIGQLAVIAIAFVTVGYWFGSKPWYRSRIAVPASIAIGLTGFYWFLERSGLIAI